MPLPTGTLVSYRPGNSTDAYPAVVFREWPDGGVELFVFHFDAGSHVRSAHPLSFDVVMDPRQITALLEGHIYLSRQIQTMQETLISLRPLFDRLKQITSAGVTEQNTPSEEEINQDLMTLFSEDEETQDASSTAATVDDGDMPEPVRVESTPTEALEEETSANPWKKRRR